MSGGDRRAEVIDLTLERCVRELDQLRADLSAERRNANDWRAQRDVLKAENEQLRGAGMALRESLAAALRARIEAETNEEGRRLQLVDSHDYSDRVVDERNALRAHLAVLRATLDPIRDALPEAVRAVLARVQP